MEIAQIKSVAHAFQVCKFIHQIHAYVPIYLLGSTCIDSGEKRMNQARVINSIVVWLAIFFVKYCKLNHVNINFNNL